MLRYDDFFIWNYRVWLVIFLNFNFFSVEWLLNFKAVCDLIVLTFVGLI